MPYLSGLKRTEVITTSYFILYQVAAELTLWVKLSSNPQYLRMWVYLKIGSLQLWLLKSKGDNTKVGNLASCVFTERRDEQPHRKVLLMSEVHIGVTPPIKKRHGRVLSQWHWRKHSSATCAPGIHPIGQCSQPSWLCHPSICLVLHVLVTLTIKLCTLLLHKWNFANAIKLNINIW